ncbi:phosphoketolase like protein [Verticillium longisporum]|nr:phosphoketolase like protein [Verticillium longisporum]
MDNPDLIVTCVVGDGEAESGPTAAAWHAIKYIDPKESGAVIPILHVNGFKISERTIFGCMDDKEIVSLFSGYGYQVYIVQDLANINEDLSNALEWALSEIKKIQKAARSGEPISKPRWPMLVMRTPKAGASIWPFASTPLAEGDQPDVVLVGIGVEVTFEVVKAAELLRTLAPSLKIRVVNVTDLMVLVAESRHPHSLTRDEFIAMFTADRPVCFNYHGYATELQGLLFGRPNMDRISIEGYREEGSTTTPFDMMLVNCVSRGVVSFGHVKDVTPEEFDRVFNINTRGQFFVAREAYKHLEEGGRLILMGSITGQAKAVPKHAVYSGSKGTIETFVRCMAIEPHIGETHFRL